MAKRKASEVETVAPSKQADPAPSAEAEAEAEAPGYAEAPEVFTVYGFRNSAVENHGVHWFATAEARNAALAHAKAKAGSAGVRPEKIDEAIVATETSVDGSDDALVGLLLSLTE
jgi:hypothetical protein